MSEFYKWWDEVGSGMRPSETEDAEEHACRIALAAWDAATTQSHAELTAEHEKYIDAMAMAVTLEHERDKAQAELAGVRKERDEAREEAEGIRRVSREGMPPVTWLVARAIARFYTRLSERLYKEEKEGATHE